MFRPQEEWLDGAGTPFNPGAYYYVGGASKLFGAVLIRYRAQDFQPIAHRGGTTPGWPFPYEELAPWYDKAERLYQVRGALGFDPTEPRARGALSVPARAGRARHRRRARAHGAGRVCTRSRCRSASTSTRWLKRAPTGWDAFPNVDHGKMDAETCALAAALAHPNVKLSTGARVERLLVEPAGRRVTGAEAVVNGERVIFEAGLVVLAAGAVNSAALLLRSAEGGLANRSDMVGRHFMNHNSSPVIAVDPRTVNDSVYQKTLGINDFYLDDGKGGPPLGNIQLLGRVTGAILKSDLRMAPEWALHLLSRRAVDWYAMSEDLPSPESRVTVDGARIRLDWKRSNWETHLALVAALKERLKAAGYPIVLTKPFDRRTPSHQCGTVRIGRDPATSPLDPYCRAWDHPNLFVVDASLLPTSAAVNPSLTVAAQALRVADRIARNDLAGNAS